MTIKGILMMVRKAKKYIKALRFIRKSVELRPISFAKGVMSLSSSNLST